MGQVSANGRQLACRREEGRCNKWSPRCRRTASPPERAAARSVYLGSRGAKQANARAGADPRRARSRAAPLSGRHQMIDWRALRPWFALLVLVIAAVVLWNLIVIHT